MVDLDHSTDESKIALREIFRGGETLLMERKPELSIRLIRAYSTVKGTEGG